MKKVGVVISCFWNTPDTLEKERLSLGEVKDEEYDIRNVTFYNIDGLAPAKDDDDVFNNTYIYCSGQTFCSPFNLKTVKAAWEANTDLLKDSIKDKGVIN
ncbi:MAG TPA: hypothetical protein DGG95_18065 [Cytophagales bacterium]|jgi:hypothetical protein|nr:hypothetical protein [Cytophagales bacterium]